MFTRKFVFALKSRHNTILEPSVELKTYSTLPEIPKIIASIEAQFESQVYSRLRQIAFDRISRQVAAGHNQFSISVDNRPSNLEGINKARKVIRVQFTTEALRLALDIMRGMLRRSIAESTITHTGHLRDDLMIVYGAPGKRFVQVTNLDEIEVEVGGLVALFPTAHYAGVVNHYVTRGAARAIARNRALRNEKRAVKGTAPIKAKLGRGVGFMGTAAERIRRAVGNVRGQKNQSIAVRVVFSKAIPAQAGLHIPPKLLGRGWPCIIIEIRATQSAKLVSV